MAKAAQTGAAFRADHDSAWKKMLDDYLPLFLAFFFPPVQEEIDWARGYESLDKELAEIRPAESTGRLLADKLFKVWLRDGRETWLLIHIEVQGRGGPAFTKRVFVYNYRLMYAHRAEVVSLAVLTGAKPGAAGALRERALGLHARLHIPLREGRGLRATLGRTGGERQPFRPRRHGAVEGDGDGGR